MEVDLVSQFYHVITPRPLGKRAKFPTRVSTCAFAIFLCFAFIEEKLIFVLLLNFLATLKAFPELLTSMEDRENVVEETFKL